LTLTAASSGCRFVCGGSVVASLVLWFVSVTRAPVFAPDLGHCWSGAVSTHHHVVLSWRTCAWKRPTRVSIPRFCGAALTVCGCEPPCVQAAALVYDVTDRASFDNVRGWLEELKEVCVWVISGSPFHTAQTCGVSFMVRTTARRRTRVRRAHRQQVRRSGERRCGAGN
jgi:hypothetical protein